MRSSIRAPSEDMATATLVLYLWAKSLMKLFCTN